MEQKIERFGTDLVRKQAIKTIDSREVAEMMEVKHKHLLGKIDVINKDLLSHKIGSAKYWIEGTYKDTSGKSNRNFQITKRGCEFLAHKTTGTKGNLFTDKYMDKFEMMEQMVDKPKTAFDLLELQFKAIKETRDQLNQVNFKTLETRKEFEEFKEDLPLIGSEPEELQALVRHKGIEILGGKKSVAYKDKSIRTKVYTDIQRELKRQFQVNKYKAIKRKHLDLAKKIVSNYKAPIILEEEINQINCQLNFNI